jgi:hypothetical protein
VLINTEVIDAFLGYLNDKGVIKRNLTSSSIYDIYI